MTTTGPPDGPSEPEPAVEPTFEPAVYGDLAETLDRGSSPFGPAQPPRDVPANVNPPEGTVGPNVPEGFGDTHVAYQLGTMAAQAWAGWPVSWATPLMAKGARNAGVIEPGNWYGAQGHSWLSSVVWACVDLNARTLSQMPPVIETSVAIPGGRSWVPSADAPPSWLTNPHPQGGKYTAWGDMVQAAVVALSMDGEAFLVADTMNYQGRPATFFVADPEAIEIVKAADGGHDYQWRKRPGQIIGGEGSTQRILHVRYLTVPGDVHGHGPLEGSRSALLVVKALEDYAAKLANRGGVPWGVLKSKQNLGDVGAQRLRAQWGLASQSRDGGPAVLTGDLELQMLTLSPKDMAQLDLLTFYAQRICAAFGVPPFMVGVSQPDGLTYANSTGLFDYHYRATLRSLAANLTTALSEWLLPRGTRLSLQEDEYVKPDLQVRSQAYQLMHNQGVLTTDEWRAIEGLGPLPAGAVTGTTNDTQAADQAATPPSTTGPVALPRPITQESA